MKGHRLARDFDEVRPEVAEASERTLMDVRKMDAPTARNVRADLEEADLSEGVELPGAIVLDELVVEIVPQAGDEFVCGECFTVRHRSQAAGAVAGSPVCRDCVEA